MERLDGRAPGERFVATIDHGYTAGVETGAALDGEESPVSPAIPRESFWLQGTLMDRLTYYGEQYLFFGYPQLYVSQVKNGFLWPSQVERLKRLYRAPLATLGSVYLVWAYPFMEEYSLRAWILVLARFLLLCSTAAAAGLWRKRRSVWLPGAVWAVGIYALTAIGLALPDL